MLTLLLITFRGQLTDSFQVTLEDCDYDPAYVCSVPYIDGEERLGVLVELPSELIQQDYAEFEDLYGIRKGKKARYDTMWRIPLTFYESLYTNDFWQAVADNGQLDALFAPRTFGWVFTSHPDIANLQPASLNDPNLPANVRETMHRVMQRVANSSVDYFAAIEMPKHSTRSRFQTRT